LINPCEHSRGPQTAARFLVALERERADYVVGALAFVFHGGAVVK
jgi:hypothetical protein